MTVAQSCPKVQLKMAFRLPILVRDRLYGARAASSWFGQSSDELRQPEFSGRKGTFDQPNVESTACHSIGLYLLHIDHPGHLSPGEKAVARLDRRGDQQRR